MKADDELLAIIKETITALSIFHEGELGGLEERVAALAKSNTSCSHAVIDALSAKHILLGEILESTESGLVALRRLHGGETRGQWVL